MVVPLMKSWKEEIRRFNLDHLYNPPDGGWGYVVVTSATISYVGFAYIMATFSLTFENKLLSIGYETTGAAVVLNVYTVFMYMSGIIFGPLIQSLSYKYGSILGGIFVFTGLFGTSFATEMWHFLVLFSGFVGTGHGLLALCNMLAVSTYFFKWRTSAVGLMMAGASAGQALFNQLVSYSMQSSGFRGTVLIMAALSLHCVVMPFLYHPLCEHGIKKPVCLEQEMKPLNAHSAGSDDVHKTAEEFRGKTSHFRNFVAIFSLELLKDPIFLNISFGLMTMFICDVNMFLIITLYMIHTADLSVQETATCQTVRAASDLICRVVATFVLNKYNVPARYCFLVSQVFAAFLRLGISAAKNYGVLITLCSIEGIFRGAGFAYFYLCLLEYGEPQKMAATLGLSSFLQGIGCLIVGPLIGKLRDSTGNYALCLCVMSGLLLLFSIMWIMEFLVLRIKGKFNYSSANQT